jgi:hypothetical protein
MEVMQTTGGGLGCCSAAGEHRRTTENRPWALRTTNQCHRPHQKEERSTEDYCRCDNSSWIPRLVYPAVAKGRMV